VTGNTFIGNVSAVYLDNSPSLYDINNIFSGNFLAYNDVGLTALPSVERNIIQNNVFLENYQQVSVQGRGDLLGNQWDKDGIGNYWSNYVGYDRAGDGVGDMPYRSEKLFESLADAHPVLRLFAYSPTTQALDFAASAFPSLRPDPKLMDTAPRMRYSIPPEIAAGSQQVSPAFLAAALALLGAGALVCALALRGRPQPGMTGIRRVKTRQAGVPAGAE
jgi:nitrous oxidase accessory protein